MRKDRARIVVKVKNEDGKNQRGVQVSGTFSGDFTGNVVEVTNNKGSVTFQSDKMDDDEAVIRFMVTHLAHPDYTYDPAANVEGPSVVVEFDD